MRCLVTGATGHIGVHLVRHLLSDDDVELAVLIRPATAHLWRIEDIVDRLRVIGGDLANIDQSAADINRFAPEIVVHLGWYGVDTSYRNDIRQVTENLNGTIKLLQVAHDSGCNRWIGLGSQAEYESNNRILTENSLTRPITLYGATKLCASILCQRMCENWNIDFLWLRLFASYGPMDHNVLIPSVILSLLQRKKPALTSGEQRWDYLFVEDVAEAIWRAAITPEARGIFNLGSGKAHTVRSIVQRIRDMIDPDLPLGFGEMPYGPDQIMHLQADISRFQQVTGWSPQVDLDEGLRRTVDWFRENRGRYGQ